jgi:hypothetical protein
MAPNDKKWFALVQGRQGEVIVHTDSNHKKDQLKKIDKEKFVNMADVMSAKGGCVNR